MNALEWADREWSKLREALRVDLALELPASWEEVESKCLRRSAHYVRALDERVEGVGERPRRLAVYQALLHVAAHARAQQLGHGDGTSRQGRYHNQHFAEAARDVGLTLETPSGTCSLRSALRTIPDLSGPPLDPFPPAEPIDRWQQRAARCGCKPPRTMRICLPTLDRAPITCGACGQPFVVDSDHGRADDAAPSGDHPPAAE